MRLNKIVYFAFIGLLQWRKKNLSTSILATYIAIFKEFSEYLFSSAMIIPKF